MAQETTRTTLPDGRIVLSRPKIALHQRLKNRETRIKESLKKIHCINEVDEVLNILSNKELKGNDNALFFKPTSTSSSGMILPK